MTKEVVRHVQLISEIVLIDDDKRGSGNNFIIKTNIVKQLFIFNNNVLQYRKKNKKKIVKIRISTNSIRFLSNNCIYKVNFLYNKASIKK